MKEEELHRIYAKAADWLEAHDWCQRDLARDADGKRLGSGNISEAVCACMAGAVYAVGGNMVDVLKLGDIAEIEGPGEWNDVPGRTKAEVIAKLREAARPTPPKAGVEVEGG